MYQIVLNPSVSVSHLADSTTVSSTTKAAKRKVSTALLEVHLGSRNGSGGLIEVGRFSAVKNATIQ